MMQPFTDYPRSFDRPVYSILGLPIDALSMDTAVARLSAEIREGRRCILSTPNVNFLVTALRNADFREAVLASDLSVADGMPLVWIARLLGLPFRERVAGASLFDAMATGGDGREIRCFFFGGHNRAAEQACTRLNESGGVMTCVGALNPGIGTVQALSRPEFIDQINEARPDFLVVSLGAAKGQAWIVANAPRLNATVISHLGAVVNFHAGTVRRAPTWMRRIGLEWLFRINQEPELAWRYLRDGLVMAWLILTRVVPSAAARLVPVRNQPQSGTIMEATDHQEALQLQMQGSFGAHNLTGIRRSFAAAAAREIPVTLDLASVESIDAAFTGALLVLKKHCDERKVSLRLLNAPRKIRRLLRRQGAEYLLQ